MQQGKHRQQPKKRNRELSEELLGKFPGCEQYIYEQANRIVFTIRLLA